MVVNERPLKRLKRRFSDDIYDFFTFPAAGGSISGDFTVGGDGEPFWKMVPRFITTYASLTYPPSLFSSLMTWHVTLTIVGGAERPDLSPATVNLDVVEEDVTRSKSSVYCDQCRVIGELTH